MPSRSAGPAGCHWCSTRPVVLTDANFDPVVANSTVPVMVDFYADWCGPCKMMAPVFTQFAKQQRGQAIVAKVGAVPMGQLEQMVISAR